MLVVNNHEEQGCLFFMSPEQSGWENIDPWWMDYCIDP